jgi:hypothetical protein
MMIPDVLMVLLTMAIFVFALQPRDHAHGGRRREADSVSDVQTHAVPGHWERYEAEAGLELQATRRTQ